MEALLREAFSQALKATDPYRLTARHLPPWRPDLVLAVGKAAYPMLRAALGRYGEVPYHLTLPKGQKAPGLRARFAGHPLPDGESLAVAEEVLALLQGLSPRARVLALLSGGGSALWCAPLGIPLEEKRALTEALLKSGTSIHEVNAVRKHLSRIQWGEGPSSPQRRRSVSSSSPTCRGTTPRSSPPAPSTRTPPPTPRPSPSWTALASPSPGPGLSSGRGRKDASPRP